VKLWRVLAAGSLAALALWACTFTRSLDYLTQGAPAGAGTSGGPGPGDEERETSIGDENKGPIITKGEPLATEQLSPQNLTQDRENLFWSGSDNSIMTVPKAGGSVRKVATTTGVIAALAADPEPGGDLFVAVGNAVLRTPKAGGGTFGEVEREDPPPVSIVVDEAHVFVLHSEGELGEGHIARWDKGGGGRAILSQELDAPVAIALSRDSVLWAGTNPDGELVVFSLPKTAPHDAGGTALVYKGGTAGLDVMSKTGFAVDDQAIYYLEYDTGRAYRANRVANAVPTPLTSIPPGSMPTALVIDTDNVYILDQRPSGGVLRVSKKGGAPEVFIPDTTIPTNLAVDEKALYFTVQGLEISAKGTVLRAPTK
jgi:hypothetical protein